MTILKGLRFQHLYGFLVVLLLVSSCKGKKKAADASDTQKVSQEIAEEIEQSEDVKAEKEKVNVVTNPTNTEMLSKYFSAISNASSIPEANGNINEALTMFSSSEAVVLIEIFRDGSVTDYDEPTTIGKYLNYLKDTKSKPAAIQDIVYDGSGKMKELVLNLF